MKWERVRDLHTEAAASFASTADSIPADVWLAPVAEKKWSPAEIVEHLNCAYDVLMNELEGGKGMAVQTKLWQRILLRLFLVPKLLRGGAFPRNARAPRELRPVNANGDQQTAIAGFRDRAARFEAAVTKGETQRRGLTHAYFGYASARHGALLATRHIQHHQKQLAAYLAKP